MDLFSRLFRRNAKIYRGSVVDLKERYRLSEALAYDGIPVVYYDILLHDGNTRVGALDLRLKSNSYQYYYGDIGYHVDPPYRGHHYAYHACQLAFSIAKGEFGMKELIITCNPTNTPSYKTLASLGGEYLGIEKVPEDHEIYRRGDREKCIFKYTL